MCRSHSRKRPRHSGRATNSGAAERTLELDDLYIPPCSRVGMLSCFRVYMPPLRTQFKPQPQLTQEQFSQS
jgi:hypothetical protein